MLVREDVGGWVMKANPVVWDIHAARAAGEELTSFRLTPSYRLDLLAVGDPVLIWVTRDHERRLPAGFMADAEVAGPPRTRSSEAGPRPYVPLRAAVWWDRILTADVVRGHPALMDLEVLRAPRIGNPSYVTPTQLAAVDDLLG